MDRHTPNQRSFNMSRVRSRGNAATEGKFAAILTRADVRGWKPGHEGFGSPDFVFPGLQLAIFIDGCFWHACPRCFKLPESNTAFWRAKIQRNVRRDREVDRGLRHRSWTVLRIWEHELRDPQSVVPKVQMAIRTASQATMRPQRRLLRSRRRKTHASVEETRSRP